MWAMRVESCAGLYMFVVRKVPPGDLVLTCDLEVSRSVLRARFHTMSGEPISDKHSFGGDTVSMTDVLSVAHAAASRSGHMRSVNQSLKVVFRDPKVLAPQRAEIWSKSIRMGPPIKRLRRKTDLAKVNLHRALLKLTERT